MIQDSFHRNMQSNYLFPAKINQNEEPCLDQLWLNTLSR